MNSTSDMSNMSVCPADDPREDWPKTKKGRLDENIKHTSQKDSTDEMRRVKVVLQRYPSSTLDHSPDIAGI